MQAEGGHGAPLSRRCRAGVGNKNILADPAGDLFEQTCLATTTRSNEHGWTSGPRLHRDRSSDRAAIRRATLKPLMTEFENPRRNGRRFVTCNPSLAGTSLDGVLRRPPAYNGDENAGCAGHRFAGREPGEGQEDRNEKRFARPLGGPAAR